jgi:hypothetical protein
MSEEEIIQTIKNTLKLIDVGDFGPNSQNAQLARMRKEPQWSEGFIQEEIERRERRPVRIAERGGLALDPNQTQFAATMGNFSLGSKEQKGGGRKKRKNRTLKKKRNKFLVYLENLYG